MSIYAGSPVLSSISKGRRNERFKEQIKKGKGVRISSHLA